MQIKGIRRVNKADMGFNILVTLLSLAALAVAIYPLYFVFIASFSNPDLVSRGEVLFWPKEFNVEAYQYILRNRNLWVGYANTILYTVLTVCFVLVVIIPAAYALSRKDLLGRRVFVLMLTFTMFFQGGLIPTYLLVSNLNLVNTRTILIVMGTVTVFNIIIARTYFTTNIPDELFEAASVDGCGNFRFFVSIILPLSKTIIAIIALYAAVAQWNSYFNAFIYITKTEYQPLQIFLRQILVMGQTLVGGEEMTSDEVEHLRRISLLVKYAIIVVSSAPIIALYPRLQKYFVKGVMIGSVKG